VQLSTPLQYDGNPRATADAVAELEKAGLDMVWVAEAYGFDSPTLMGYLAAKTERLQIAAGILNVFSRTPGAILQTAAGLDNVSAGRAVLGLGASGPQVIEGFHGLPYDKPLGRTREVIRIVRSGLKREPLQASGIFNLPLPADQGLGLGKPLKILVHPERDTIPIWVASLGDKNVEMTAGPVDIQGSRYLYILLRSDAVQGQPGTTATGALVSGTILLTPTLAGVELPTLPAAS